MQRQVPIISATRLQSARTLAGTSLVIVALAAFAGSAKAQLTPTLPSTGTIAVPTYESAGLTWQSPGGSAGCEVKFRKGGASAWTQGLAMWYDARDSQCRGSLVGLEAGTGYQVEFNLPGQPASRGLVFTTWSNTRPVAKTIAVNSGSGTFNVAEGGSAAGYVVYDGQGATLDAQNNAQYNVTINASYVILRGLNLRGAKQDAIRISPNVSDVIIEDNDISGWGRTRDGTWGTDMDSGIRAVCSDATQMPRVTIQRNRIHDPRYGANSWSDGHPAGPQAITISYCAGHLVIRHNEMYSTTGRYFNDVIGGEDNFTNTGFPNADTDIYGNKLSHAWDDAIEAEGANENVRIWGNYIDRTATGVATTVTAIGPAYIFRNVWNRSKFYEKAAPDADDRAPFFKSGSDAGLGNGRRYVFHNTMLQATQSGATYGLGGGYGMGGTGASQLVNNTWSMNNIYHLWKPGKTAFYETGSGNNINSDMYNGTPGSASIVNGINATPTYAGGHGWTSEANGNYQLAAGTAGHGRGIRIANFNDGAAAPDVGAHQSGTAAMAFGIAGSRGSAVGGSTSTLPPPPPPAPPATGVTVNPGALGNFGTQRTQSATFTNNTSSSVTFIRATMSSTRYMQSNNCGVVAPGASCTATITYYANWGGSASGSLTVTSTAPNSPHVVSLSATAITVSPPPPTGGTGVAVSVTGLTFGTTQATQAVTYTNNTGAKVTFLQASMSSTKFTQTNNCGDVAAGASCTAQVTYNPSYGGATSGTFTVTSTAPNSPHTITLTAGSTTTTPPTSPPVAGGVTINPTTLAFSIFSRSKSAVVTNNTGSSLTFTGAATSSGKFAVVSSCGVVAAGASCAVTVTYNPLSFGATTGLLTLTSTAGTHTAALVVQ